nr:ATP-dependent zinc metalloprotease FTSH, chloroplastic [Tanacetum cinerariifolium]
GTGKTLLARAVAGEAGVPFFSCAASEFVELFVGVGASRVRDLFEKAKSKAPCIVFIDEIDAVGRQRGAGMGGGNDEREQTINQLLTEMDGFSGNSGVIVLAATNRPDVLDSALLRPGRSKSKFQEVPETGVSFADVAGADQAKLELQEVVDFLKNPDKYTALGAKIPKGCLLVGPPGTGKTLLARAVAGEAGVPFFSCAASEFVELFVEAGHALVGALMPEYDPVAKISIIPRGQAGGLTFFAPSEERLESGLYSRSYLENQMAVALGGRVAEEVIFGKEFVTTGASNDFMQVSRVARQMVERFGFSKKIGQVAIGGGGGNPFLGQSMSSQKDYSMATADIVDAEVRELVEIAYERATNIITTQIDILHKLAQLLIEKETVDGEEFMSLFIDGKAELYIS